MAEKVIEINIARFKRLSITPFPQLSAHIDFVGRMKKDLL